MDRGSGRNLGLFSEGKVLGNRLMGLIRKSTLALKIITNRRKEPFLSFGAFMKCAVKNGNPYPLMNYVDFKDLISVRQGKSFKFLKYKNEEYAYPVLWSDSLCIANLNGILNEQVNADSPHRYLSSDEIRHDWVIYDVGGAEGYQAKQWSKKARKVIIFEPSEEWYESLRETFNREIETGKVEVLNIGLSDEERTIDDGSGKLHLMSLDTVVEKYGMPYPDYIKVDIEGEEARFLNGAKRVLTESDVKRMDICVYHRPKDYIDIPKMLSIYKGSGSFSSGIIVLDRDGIVGGNYRRQYHPIFRRCLYRYDFKNGRE